MLKGLNLVDFARKIEANRELKRDMIANSRDLVMTVDDDRVVKMNIGGGEGAYPILHHAHDQIGARLGIPSKYYDRMLGESPQLLVNNTNHWFSKSQERRMIRTLGGDMRAYLSDRYNRIENEEIAEVALPILGDIPDVQFVSTEVTDKRMYIQAVAPRIQGEVKLNDIVQAGVVISNSEIGMGSVSVAPMIWRLRCLNGMVVPDSKFRAYHVGKRVEDSEQLWADDTRKADDRAILLKVRDVVRAAVDAARFHEKIEQMRGLTTAHVTGSPERAVEVLAQKVGVTDTERSGLLRSLIEGGDLSAWGLLNAVTAQAHTARDYDRAVEFETAGGQLLTMSKSEWKEVLTAE